MIVCPLCVEIFSPILFYFFGGVGGGWRQVGTQCESAALFGTWAQVTRTELNWGPTAASFSTNTASNCSVREKSLHTARLLTVTRQASRDLHQNQQEAFTVELNFVVLVVEVTSDPCSGSLMRRFKDLVTSGKSARTGSETTASVWCSEGPQMEKHSSSEHFSRQWPYHVKRV